MRTVEPIHTADQLREFAGQWVAIRDGEVVAAAETPDRLLMHLRDKKWDDASIVRAPAEGEAVLVGLG